MRSLPNFGLLVLRCMFSALMFLNHGLDKLTHFSATSKSFPNVIGLGSEWSAALVVLSEVFMQVFIFFGLFTRLACVPPIISMGVAAFIFHAQDPLSNKEMALLYFAVYVAIATLGPGTISLDHKFRHKT